jgi:hypothetical protein
MPSEVWVAADAHGGQQPYERNHNCPFRIEEPVSTTSDG